MNCRSYSGVYHPWHGEDSNGHCPECGEIVDRRKHAAHVANLRQRLREAEAWEDEIEQTTETGDSLRLALKQEGERALCCKEQLT